MILTLFFWQYTYAKKYCEVVVAICMHAVTTVSVKCFNSAFTATWKKKKTLKK